MRSTTIKSTVGVVLGLLVALCSSASAQEAAVVFANDGSFAKINLAQMTITKKGTLRDIGYFEAFGVSRTR